MAKAKSTCRARTRRRPKGSRQVDKVDIHSAAWRGEVDDIKLMLDFYPDRVHSKDVTILAHPAQLLIVCPWWIDRMGGPLYTAQ